MRIRRTSFLFLQGNRNPVFVGILDNRYSGLEERVHSEKWGGVNHQAMLWNSSFQEVVCWFDFLVTKNIEIVILIVEMFIIGHALLTTKSLWVLIQVLYRT